MALPNLSLCSMGIRAIQTAVNDGKDNDVILSGNVHFLPYKYLFERITTFEIQFKLSYLTTYKIKFTAELKTMRV